LKTPEDKLEHCKEQTFKNKCFKSCGYCPKSPPPSRRRRLSVLEA